MISQVNNDKLICQLLCFGLLIMSEVYTASGQACTTGDVMGYPPENRTIKDTEAADYQFLVHDTVLCYGLVESWEFWNNGDLGLCHDVTFQVWRPDPVTGDYTLIGSNPYICYNDTEGREFFGPPSSERIPLQPGDVYGWIDEYVDGNTSRLFNYEDALPGSGEFFDTYILPLPGCSITAGDTCVWGAHENRGYSLQPNLGARPDPYFTNLPRTTSVYEKTPLGIFIYRAAGYNDFNYNDVVNPDLTYSIIGGSCANEFDINTTTGEIRTNVTPLDFETMTSCNIRVQVAEGPNTATETLTIDIKDVNEPHIIDNLPDIVVTRSALNTPNDQMIKTVTITDEDNNAAFPPMMYRIVSSDPPNPPFYIVTTAAGGEVRSSQDLSLWPGPALFSLQILVTDGVHGAGPAELVIDIDDIRAKPHITNLDAITSVDETSNTVTLLHKVEAETDPLSDPRGSIRFAIKNIYPLTTATNLFTINANSGDVRHIANPGFNYFNVKEYQIEIEATWVGPPDLVSEARNLTLQINFVNSIPYHQPWAKTFKTNINEKEAINTSLPSVLLDAYDRDLPHGDYLIFTIDSHLFRINNVTRTVHVAEEIRLGPGHSYQETFTYEILVVDSFSMTDNATLEVTITDINDHNPVFFGDPYSGKILETSPGGTTTGINLTVTDDDAGINAELHFTILEAIPASYFQVQEITPGQYAVTNKQPIPYEIYKNMTFTVMAIDNGDVELNGTAVVFVEILEGNTNVPFFDPEFFAMDLRSDTPVDQAVHTLWADDLDSDNVQILRYYWLIIDDYFRLEDLSGEIIIDRELVASRKHLLYVAAQDEDIYGRDRHHSKPYTLRIDTYNPQSTLVDIFLNIPLADFLASQTVFLDTLNSAVPQWDMRIESVRLQGTDTVVRVYAVESALPDLPQNQHLDKKFIDEDDVVKLLRAKLKGTPSDILKGPDFAPWEPVKVQPAYPIWIIDTPGGVALLTILCALFVGGLITMFVLLAKKFGWCCYKNKHPKIKKSKVKPVGQSEDPMKLNYLVDGEKPYHISNNDSLGKTYGGYQGPLLPMSTFKSAPQPPPKDDVPKAKKKKVPTATLR